MILKVKNAIKRINLLDLLDQTDKTGLLRNINKSMNNYKTQQLIRSTL